jgi:hypothetical protein
MVNMKRMAMNIQYNQVPNMKEEGENQNIRVHDKGIAMSHYEGELEGQNVFLKCN